MGMAKNVVIRDPGMLRYLWLSALLVLLDQVTKLWVLAEFQLYEVREILPVFNLVLVYNQGAAFSFLSDAGGWQKWFFICLSSVISLVLLIWLARLKRSEAVLAVALAMILGGAVGNLVDRIRYGHVVDFLDFHWQQWHWPAFNVADSAIVLGVALLILLTVFTPDESASVQ